ncbi:MAG: hypothetical protein ABSD20_09840, partial [Terriglobales bacterium]
DLHLPSEWSFTSIVASLFSGSSRIGITPPVQAHLALEYSASSRADYNRAVLMNLRDIVSGFFFAIRRQAPAQARPSLFGCD